MTATPASTLLSRRPHRPPPALTLWDEVALPLARVHEVCGGARRTLALQLAAPVVRREAPLFWISPRHNPDPLHTCGMVEWLDPSNVIFVASPRPIETLWAMEEILRSGTAPMAIAELPQPPGMTPVRRLHLAAEEGARIGAAPPLGLLLTPGAGGAPGIETRWRYDAAHGPERRSWRLERMRARMLPPKVWRVENGALAPWDS